MKIDKYISILFSLCVVLTFSSCEEKAKETKPMISAQEVLSQFGGNALSYGGYRHTTRDSVPSVADLKEDMLILNQMGCHLIRTYHTQQYGQVKNLLQAIDELKQEQENFEMYVMMGAWIQCKDAWTEQPVHEDEDAENNRAEMDQAIAFAKQYPEIIKIIAVGNEAMVHWATGYFVYPNTILKYVEEVQGLKSKGELDSSIWVTSSDNFASWGGGTGEYHHEDLNRLIQAVDYVSLHTYPFHDTHYNSAYWINEEIDSTESDEVIARKAVDRAIEYAQNQYQKTKTYVQAVKPNIEAHIGETGWASIDVKLYGENGSAAADEVKQAWYYQGMRNWTQKENIACFYFQAFDEPWKDAKTPGGSENHFGLISVDGEVKYPIWDLFDSKQLDQYNRGSFQLRKSFQGDSSLVQSNLLKLPI